MKLYTQIDVFIIEWISFMTSGMVPVLPKLLEQGTPEQRADRDYVLKVFVTSREM